MTIAAAKQYVADHSDDDIMDSADLMDCFTALAGRAPNAQESEALWSHCCEMGGL